ncbi:hypothetical protein GCM10023219_30800 [Stakelama sediminis]|uniref:DNA-binding beta-propeller fold protein YncE n=1 Tax=Stakelama sediminis TaxID=463200 RepID=A0A840Z171_9SPHN|nr:gluconolactonase [Stakelama sediminis]MBB5719728.1 DNA-binding beta-propeller fold protein YncE [Stakelama sediminis]
MSFRSIVASGLAVSLATIPIAHAAPRIVARIAAADGGWDYTKVDPVGDRLYVARSNDVTVVDLKGQKALAAIGHIAHGHAVVPIPHSSTLLVTSGNDDSVRLIDETNGKQVARIAVGSDPDAAFYSQSLGRAAVMNAKSGTISLIDVPTHKVMATITLKPGLEYAAQGPGSSLFVNNEDESELETADLSTAKAGAAIALPGCKSPSGLAYDSASGMLISACDNGKAAIIDAHSRKLVKLLDIGSGPDAVILDAARRKAYIPCGDSGTLSIISMTGKAGPHISGVMKTERGARTGALDPRTGLLYLPTARFAPGTTGHHAPLVPGSFHILVVKPF